MRRLTSSVERVPATTASETNVMIIGSGLHRDTLRKRMKKQRRCFELIRRNGQLNDDGEQLQKDFASLLTATTPKGEPLSVTDVFGGHGQFRFIFHVEPKRTGNAVSASVQDIDQCYDIVPLKGRFECSIDPSKSCKHQHALRAFDGAPGGGLASHLRRTDTAGDRCHRILFKYTKANGLQEVNRAELSLPQGVIPNVAQNQFEDQNQSGTSPQNTMEVGDRPGHRTPLEPTGYTYSDSQELRCAPGCIRSPRGGSGASSANYAGTSATVSPTASSPVLSASTCSPRWSRLSYGQGGETFLFSDSPMSSPEQQRQQQQQQQRKQPPPFKTVATCIISANKWRQVEKRVADEVDRAIESRNLGTGTSASNAPTINTTEAVRATRPSPVVPGTAAPATLPVPQASPSNADGASSTPSSGRRRDRVFAYMDHLGQKFRGNKRDALRLTQDDAARQQSAPPIDHPGAGGVLAASRPGLPNQPRGFVVRNDCGQQQQHQGEAGDTPSRGLVKQARPSHDLCKLQDEGEDEKDGEAEIENVSLDDGGEEWGMWHIQAFEQFEQSELDLNLDMMLNGVADIAVPPGKRKSVMACAEGGGLGMQGGIGVSRSSEAHERKRSRFIKRAEIVTEIVADAKVVAEAIEDVESMFKHSGEQPPVQSIFDSSKTFEDQAAEFGPAARAQLRANPASWKSLLTTALSSLSMRSLRDLDGMDEDEAENSQTQGFPREPFISQEESFKQKTEPEKAQLRAEVRNYLDARDDSQLRRISESGEELMKIAEKLDKDLSSRSFGRLSFEADDDSTMKPRARDANRADLDADDSRPRPIGEPGQELMKLVEQLDLGLAGSFGKLSVVPDDEEGKDAEW